MTDDQKKYYNAMKKLSASGPAKATPRPKVITLQTSLHYATHRDGELNIRLAYHKLFKNA